MKPNLILIAAVALIVAFFAAVTVEGQGLQLRQRRRDGSATQPATPTQQAAVAPSSPGMRSTPPYGRGFGGRWLSSNPGSRGQCWWNAQTGAPTTLPSPQQAATPPQSNTAQAAAPPITPGISPSFGPRSGRGMGFGPPQAMLMIHSLLTEHLDIRRDVEDVPGGVTTVTTSDKPAVAQLIQAHVAQMQDALKQGRPIRQWDPLFVELFANRDKIHMKVEQIPGGVKVLEFSDDEQVAKLLRQHARRGVSEFVADGWARVHQPTPLPQGYGRTSSK